VRGKRRKRGERWEIDRKKEKGTDEKIRGERKESEEKEKEKRSEKKEGKGRETRGRKVKMGKERKLQLATGECERWWK
jgi:hypothetical protein